MYLQACRQYWYYSTAYAGACCTAKYYDSSSNCALSNGFQLNVYDITSSTNASLQAEYQPCIYGSIYAFSSGAQAAEEETCLVPGIGATWFGYWWFNGGSYMYNVTCVV